MATSAVMRRRKWKRVFFEEPSKPVQQMMMMWKQQCRDIVELVKFEGIAETARKKLAKETRSPEEAARMEQLQKEERRWAKQRIVLAEEQKAMLEWELARIQM
jgi:hypothetical protein